MTVVEQMGYVAQQIDAPGDVDAWFGIEEIDELSEEEARVLALRWTQELESGGIIDAAGRVTEPLRSRFFSAFRDAAKRWTIEGMRIDEGTIRAALSEAEARRVLRWIEERIRQPNAADHGPR